jgi:hypothetical protein
MFALNYILAIMVLYSQHFYYLQSITTMWVWTLLLSLVQILEICILRCIHNKWSPWCQGLNVLWWLSLIIFYTIHFEIYIKIHPTFDNVIYLYTLMNFKCKKSNVYTKWLSFEYNKWLLSRIKYILHNSILNWTLHYLEEIYHIKSFFKHTKVENWT